MRRDHFHFDGKFDPEVSDQLHSSTNFITPSMLRQRRPAQEQTGIRCLTSGLEAGQRFRHGMRDAFELRGNRRGNIHLTGRTFTRGGQRIHALRDVL